MNETKDELRVKVAELLGWTPAKSTGFVVHGWASPDGKQFCTLGRLPNWPNDLNACAEFEKTLKPAQKLRYAEMLDVILHHPGDLRSCFGQSYFDGKDYFQGTYGEVFDIATATAEQRCRAFIATMETSSVPYEGDLLP